MPWTIRVFFPMLVVWLLGILLICGICGRGVGDVIEENTDKSICQLLRTRVLSCGLIANLVNPG
jgi:hypothetical protein